MWDIRAYSKGWKTNNNFRFCQSYLKDLWVRVEKSKDAGLSAEEAAEKIDMSDHGKNYPQIQGAGVDPRAVVRIYRRLEEAGK